MSDRQEPSLADLGVDPGLCRDCVHRRLTSSGRSTFLRCALARTDPVFPRYPPLPVLGCAGFTRVAESGSERSG